jgi:hypothetical protein
MMMKGLVIGLKCRYSKERICVLKHHICLLHSRLWSYDFFFMIQYYSENLSPIPDDLKRKALYVYLINALADEGDMMVSCFLSK